MVIYALQSAYPVANGWLNEFEVEGFTSAYLRVDDDKHTALFYANPFVYGRERYHFAMVTFTDEDNDTPNACPARILSFVEFPTTCFFNSGAHSRRHVECRCQSITQLSLCYSSHRDLSYEKLDEMFTASFILADMKKCVYIVNVDAISNCLYVFRNYGEDGMQYYCALPYRRWGNYFRHKI